MGPAVSRPDDQVVGTTAVQTLTKLQWGRPFHGRMTHSGSGWPNDSVPASMGPAVSRPDDMNSVVGQRSGMTSRFNGAGRFTAG